MQTIENDLEVLENAMRLFFQTMKRPQHWSRVTERAGIMIDRPAAGILKTLMTCPSPCRVQDLADNLGVEAPSITRKTQELEQAGYLRRVPDKNDRRVTDLHITRRGRSAANRLWKSQREIVAEILQNWDPAERRAFVQSFMKFSDELATSMPHGRQTASHRGDVRV